MKNTKHLLLLLPIALIVFTAGCTTGGLQTGNGVIILNFEPDFSSVESTDQVRLYLQIQNLGGEQAYDVRARITGIDPVEWQVETEWPFDSLIPPNTAYGTEGETAQYYFTTTAPILPEGQTLTYNPMVRIYYDYFTTATKQITVVAEDELRRLVQQGNSLPVGDTQYSAGPISVDVVTGKYIKARPEGDYYFPITITLNNIGNGVVSSYKTGYSNSDYSWFRDWTVPDQPIDYWVSMKIILPSGLRTLPGDSCEVFAAQYENGVFQDTFGDFVELWKGKSATITCKLLIDRPLPVIAQQKTLSISLLYPYYTDSTTSVTVKGLV